MRQKRGAAMPHCVLLVALALTLAGCVSTDDGRVYYRTDGRAIRGNPHMVQQFEADATVCRGEEAKAGLAAPASVPAGVYHRSLDAIGEGCMAQRGYVLRARKRP